MNSVFKKINFRNINQTLKSYKILFNENYEKDMKTYSPKEIINNSKFLKDTFRNHYKSNKVIGSMFFRNQDKNAQSKKIEFKHTEIYLSLGMYSLFLLINSSSNGIFYIFFKNFFVSYMCITMVHSTEHFAADFLSEQTNVEKIKAVEEIRNDLIKVLGITVTSLYLSNPITNIIGSYLFVCIFLNSTRKYYDNTPDFSIKLVLSTIGFLTLFLTLSVCTIKSLNKANEVIKSIIKDKESTNI